MKRLVILISGVLVIGAVALWLVPRNQSSSTETGDIRAQGGLPGDAEEPLATNGAHLTRSESRIQITVEAPTPLPDSYTYPTGNMVPPGALPHPEVLVGSADEPEVFTLWVFVFNNSDACSDGVCGSDDVGADAPALGGVYQIGGQIADTSTLDFQGGIRLGQTGAAGAPLSQPATAEIHFAISPHGKALEGTDLLQQLNSSVGNPILWWGASFVP